MVIELSIKRGKTSLSIRKAEQRDMDNLDRPFDYWTRDLTIGFEEERRTSGRIEIGKRLKELRTRRGVSQTELARLVGVTPSTISQIESNLIYPSVPALLKMAEVLSVETSSFFHEAPATPRRFVFPSYEAIDVRVGDKADKAISAKALVPGDLETRAEPFLIEIPPKKRLSSHFFMHKGEEMGYLLSGKLQLTVDKTVYKLRSGDVVYFTSEIPSQWKNPGPSVARLLWINMK